MLRDFKMPYIDIEDLVGYVYIVKVDNILKYNKIGVHFIIAGP
jgi:hypothetical protein